MHECVSVSVVWLGVVVSVDGRVRLSRKYASLFTRTLGIAYSLCMLLVLYALRPIFITLTLRGRL